MEEQNRRPLPRFGDVQANAGNVDVAVRHSVDLRWRSVHCRESSGEPAEPALSRAPSTKGITAHNRLPGPCPASACSCPCFCSRSSSRPKRPTPSATPNEPAAPQRRDPDERRRRSEGECVESEDEEAEGAEEAEEECEAEAEDAGFSPAEDCYLRTATARVVAYPDREMMRLTLGYTTYAPAAATVEYGAKKDPHLGTVHRQLGRSGVLRLSKHLAGGQMTKVEASGRFTVTVHVPEAPARLPALRGPAAAGRPEQQGARHLGRGPLARREKRLRQPAPRRSQVRGIDLVARARTRGTRPSARPLRAARGRARRTRPRSPGRGGRGR